MTIKELLVIIGELESSNLLRDESRVEFVIPANASEDDVYDVESAERESQDRLTLRA